MKIANASALLQGTNSLLGLADLKLVRHREQDWSDPTTFLPLKETLAGAQAAGLPLGEYIENQYNVPGTIDVVMKELDALGAFTDRRERVCEIGPGSARFLEPIKVRCRSAHYEVYETAAPWAAWLQDKYDVVLRPTDGTTLASTADRTIDLVHAHKVLVCIPMLGICRYLQEMMRVARSGAFIVFDAFTDECLPDGEIAKWLATDVNAGAYPSLILKRVIEELLDTGGFDLHGTFFVPMKPGTTQYFVFQKR